MDIREFTDSQPVSPQARAQLVEPLIAAASFTFAELAQTELVVRSVCRTAVPVTKGDISAVLGLAADGGELLVLSFPATTAAALARRVLAEVTDSPDDGLVNDCMGELANVVAGQAKTLLAETPYQLLLATPRLVEGPGLEVQSAPGALSLAIIFGSEVGDFALQVCLRPR